MDSSTLPLLALWEAQVRAVAREEGRHLEPQSELFLFRIYGRVRKWLGELGGPRSELEGAGLHYLEVLRLTVRKTLIEANEGLVRREALGALRHARASGRELIAMTLDDFVQEGHVGLLIAVDRFDCTRGVRFSTYAVPVIRRHIDCAIVEKEPLIYLPEHALKSLREVHTFSRDFRERQGKAPSHSEIMSATGVTEETLQAILAVGRRVASAESGEEHRGVSLLESPDPEAVDALRELVSSELSRVVRRAIDSLDPQEREVLRSRFGLEGQPELSQVEVGRKLGLCQQRIVQIENRALLKLLVAARQQGLESREETSLDRSLAALRDYGIDETDGLGLLSAWINQSDRFCSPAYVKARLSQLEGLGLSKWEIGSLLRKAPENIRITTARRSSKDAL